MDGYIVVIAVMSFLAYSVILSRFIQKIVSERHMTKDVQIYSFGVFIAALMLIFRFYVSISMSNWGFVFFGAFIFFLTILILRNLKYQLSLKKERCSDLETLSLKLPYPVLCMQHQGLQCLV